MASRTVRFDDFSGGEYGDLTATGARPNMFSGSNVMRYNDGTIGPRPGLKDLGLEAAVPEIRYVTFDGTGDYASVPDDAGFSALSDLSIVALVALTDWTPSAGQAILTHFRVAGNQRSLYFGVFTAGTFDLTIGTNGPGSTPHLSTAAPVVSNGDPLWIAVTRNATAGTIKFYTAPYADSVTPPAIGDFTQLGTDVASALTGALHDSTTSLVIGARDLGTAANLDGKVYRAQLYSGIYGEGLESLLVDFDPTNDSSGAGDTSWSDGTYTWTLNNDAAVVVIPATPGTSAGPIWGFRGLGARATNGVVFGQSANVYGYTFSPLGAVTAVGTVSVTATTASQIIQYGLGKGELARSGDKIYEIGSETPIVSPLSGSPGAKTLTPFGIRLMAANGAITTTVTASQTATSVTAKRVYYSAPAELTSWPALNFFDVGNISWPVEYLDEIRQRLVIANSGGEWWALTGTPGVNDSLKRQPRGDLSPSEWYHAARIGETIWFFPQGDDFPVQFTGIVVDKLRYRHLRFTGGTGTDYSLTALPVAEMVLALEDGGDNRGMLLAHDTWTFHDFGVDISKYATPPSVGGIGADLDMPVLITDGGSSGAAPVFYAFAPTLDRPGKVGDTYAQPGDASTTPLDAHLYTPAIPAKDGNEIWARKVTIDGFTYNTGSASTNHFDCVLRTFFRRNLDNIKDSDAISFDEPTGDTPADKTPFRWVKHFGAQQKGAAVQVRLDNLRGVTIRSIEVECFEDTTT